MRPIHVFRAFRRLSTAYDRLLKKGNSTAATAATTTTGSGGSSTCHSTARPSGFTAHTTEGDAKWRRRDTSAASSGELDRKWWEQKSWREIEAEIAREEAAFQHELVASKERAAARAANKTQKRKRNDRRVAGGLAELYAKYSLRPEPPADAGQDGVGRDDDIDAAARERRDKRGASGTNPWEAVGAMRSKRPKRAPKPAKVQWPPRGPPLATTQPQPAGDTAFNTAPLAPAATAFPAAPPTPPPPWEDGPAPRGNVGAVAGGPTLVKATPAGATDRTVPLDRAEAVPPSVGASSGGGGGGGGGGKWSHVGWQSVVVPDGVAGDGGGAMPPGKAK